MRGQGRGVRGHRLGSERSGSRSERSWVEE